MMKFLLHFIFRSQTPNIQSSEFHLKALPAYPKKKKNRAKALSCILGTIMYMTQ